MFRIERSIAIKAPPENVWEMLAWDRFPEWEEGYRKNVKNVEYTSEVRSADDKYRVGATARITTNREEFNVEIVESRTHEKLAGRSKPKGVENLQVTFTLSPTEAGTEMTYALDIEMSYGILGKLFGKLGQRSGKKELERSLEMLKTILEQ